MPQKFHRILFDYEINLSSDNKNLVYAASLSESKRVMCWRPILEEFGPNIQHISGVDKILADTLSIFTYNPSDKDEPCTSKAQCCANKLFAIGREENNDNCFSLNLLIIKRQQQK